MFSPDMAVTYEYVCNRNYMTIEIIELLGDGKEKKKEVEKTRNTTLLAYQKKKKKLLLTHAG